MTRLAAHDWNPAIASPQGVAIQCSGSNERGTGLGDSRWIAASLRSSQ